MYTLLYNVPQPLYDSLDIKHHHHQQYTIIFLQQLYFIVIENEKHLKIVYEWFSLKNTSY